MVPSQHVYFTRSILEPLAALKSEVYTGDPEHAYGEVM